MPPQALALIKRFEGLSLSAYLCPAGVWTIGYGSTRLDGRAVTSADRLYSPGEAESLLIDQLERDYLPRLRQIPGWAEMGENQQSALISFAWNLGANFYGAVGFQTLTNALKNKDWGAVPAALCLYVKAGGRTLPGLVDRRNAEAALWRQGQQPQDQGDGVFTIQYFLDFAMGLDTDGRLEEGRLVLRSLSPQGGRTHQVWVATSSVASKQAPESFHQKGGPIPPEYRVPNLRAWEVETAPVYLPGVRGVEGNFYKILPFLVTTDQGGQRGDLGVHRDANVPGSAGCIVLSAERFKSFESEMRRLHGLGYSKLSLFVTYPTN